MRPFSPTLSISDTAQNIRGFIKDNKEIFWTILKPLLPWIIGLNLFDIIVDATTDMDFGLGGLIASYFYTCLIITWHRVVIHGPDQYVPMNPFEPKRHELVFIGMGILIGIASAIIGAIAGVSLAIQPILGTIILIATIGFLILLGVRLSFYFPAKATDNSITFKQSFDLSKGYFWLLIGSGFWAPIKIILIMIAYFIIGALVLGGLLVAAGGSEGGSTIASIIGFLYALPIIVYFTPLLYAYGVTVLSNYYQHALQYKGLNNSDDQ